MTCYVVGRVRSLVGSSCAAAWTRKGVLPPRHGRLMHQLSITTKSHISNQEVSSLVGDPDLEDPFVFEPPGSGYVPVSQRYGSGSGSFHHQAKRVRKTLIPAIFCEFFFKIFFKLFFYLDSGASKALRHVWSRGQASAQPDSTDWKDPRGVRGPARKCHAHSQQGESRTILQTGGIGKNSVSALRADSKIGSRCFQRQKSENSGRVHVHSSLYRSGFCATVLSSQINFISSKHANVFGLFWVPCYCTQFTDKHPVLQNLQMSSFCFGFRSTVFSSQINIQFFKTWKCLRFWNF